MKKFLKLTELSKKEMAKVIGGRLTGGNSLLQEIVPPKYYCGCACAYANQGGSSSGDNGAANSADGLHSPGT